MTDIVCISPIDGKELVRRPAAAMPRSKRPSTQRAAAQKAWRRLSIAERSAYVLRSSMHAWR